MTEILPRILAYMDALLLPEPGETPGGDSMANRRAQHVQDYHLHGIPWRPTLLDPERTAKQAERDLSSLIAFGMVLAPNERRREHIRLTPYGHALARLLTGWDCSIDRAFSVIEVMHKARKRAAWWQGRPWLSIVLTPSVRAEVLFALGHGWITADSDQYGLVMFSITEAGDDALKSGMVNDVSDKAVSAFRDIYKDTYKAARKIIQALPLLNESDLHIFMPMPAGGWGLGGGPRARSGKRSNAREVDGD
ncbi:MAG: hypothetical protein WCI03_03660 [bacterium]